MDNRAFPLDLMWYTTPENPILKGRAIMGYHIRSVFLISRPQLPAGWEVLHLPNQIVIAKTVNCVIVHHSHSLHKGITDRRAYELEAAFLQIFAHRLGFQGVCRNLGQTPPHILYRPASHEPPNIGIEATKLFLNSEEGLGIDDG